MSNSSGEPKREYQLRQESGQLSREVIAEEAEPSNSAVDRAVSAERRMR